MFENENKLKVILDAGISRTEGIQNTSDLFIMGKEEFNFGKILSSAYNTTYCNPNNITNLDTDRTSTNRSLIIYIRHLLVIENH